MIYYNLKRSVIDKKFEHNRIEILALNFNTLSAIALSHRIKIIFNQQIIWRPLAPPVFGARFSRCFYYDITIRIPLKGNATV